MNPEDRKILQELSEEIKLSIEDKELQEVLDKTTCQKSFICYKSGFKNLCRAEDVGEKYMLVCLEEKPEKCKFSFPVEGASYCQCPVRVYIAKKLEK